MQEKDDIEDRLQNVMQEDKLVNFFTSSGMTPEDIKMIMHSEGPDIAPDSNLLQAELQEDIDCEEHLTDIQIKDGISRLKQLALKALTYVHVVNGISMSAVFLDGFGDREEAQFHLQEDK